MTEPRIRLCLISPVAPPYGGITHWTSLILQHAATRDDILIHQINISPRWRSIHSRGILLRAFGGALQLSRDCAKLCYALLCKRFDALHLTTSGQLAAVRDIVFALLARIFAVPLVLHVRFGRIPSIASRETFEWRLISVVLRLCTRVVVIDRPTYETCRIYLPHSKVELVPNCVNFRSLPEVEGRNDSRGADSYVVLFLGWVIPGKGIEELLLSWDRLGLEGWELNLVGPCDPVYRKYLSEKFRLENVRFLGELLHGEAMKRLARCDLFVLPSYTEGFPNVVVEAMALACPIISTEVGAVPEMLDGGAGIVVKPRDASALEGAMHKLMFDTQLRHQLGQAAREKASRCYSIDAVFSEYMRVWSDVKR